MSERRPDETRDQYIVRRKAEQISDSGDGKLVEFSGAVNRDMRRKVPPAHAAILAKIAELTEGCDLEIPEDALILQYLSLSDIERVEMIDILRVELDEFNTTPNEANTITTSKGEIDE
jgi:hypothetical protein